MNAVDPLGLFGFLLPFLGGTGLATGIAGLGSVIAGLAADGAEAVAGKNKEDPLKASKGVANGMAGAATVNGAIAAGAAGVTSAANTASAIGASAPTLIRQDKDALKNVSGKAKDAVKAGIDYAKANPDKMDHSARVGKDLVDPNMPPETLERQIANIGMELDKTLKTKKKKSYEKIDLLILSGEVVNILLSLTMFFDIGYCTRYDYCWEWGTYHIEMGGVVLGIGLFMLVIAFRKGQMKRPILMCPKCERPYCLYVKSKRCPSCDIDMEPLDGFYERHPELKNNN